MNIAEGAASGKPAAFAQFLRYAFPSLKGVITCLELCQRIYPSLPTAAAAEALIDEGEQIARMTRALAGRVKP